MDGIESSRSRSKRDHDDEEDLESGPDRRRHRSSKSRRHDEPEEKRKGSSVEKTDGRKKLAASSRSGAADSEDDDDYNSCREPRPKTPKKNPDDRRSGDGYRELETESRKGKSNENERERDSSRRSAVKASVHESERRSRTDSEYEKSQEKDRYSDRKEGSGRDKGHSSREQDRNLSRRRWDEAEPSKKPEEVGYGEKSESRSAKVSEIKGGQSRERMMDVRKEPSESKGKIVDPIAEKGSKSAGRDEKKIDIEKSKGRARSDVKEEDVRLVANVRESRQESGRDERQRRDNERGGDDLENNVHWSGSRAHGEKVDRHKQQRELQSHGSRDDADVHERGGKMDEDMHARLRDRGVRDVRIGRRSRSPERRHHWDSDEVERGYSESDNERGGTLKGKEREKDNYRDDRSVKGKDGGWNERSREREAPKDQWKRSQPGRQDREHREGDMDYDYDKDWESKRRDQDWVDNEKLYGRGDYRKDHRNRSDGMRSSAGFRNANEHSDTIEIKPNKNLDFGREEPTQKGRRLNAGLQQVIHTGTEDEEWALPGEEGNKMPYGYGNDYQDRYPEDGSPSSSRRNSLDSHGGKLRGQKPHMNFNAAGTGQVSSTGLQSPFGNNQLSGSHIRGMQQGAKGSRHARGGRGRPAGRDNQRVGLPLPMMGPPFGHLGLPPGPMPPMGPNVPPSPGPPIGPNVFIPPFPGPLIWPGARGVDMNMLAVPPSISPIPPGPVGPRFPQNMAAGPNPGIFFNQPGPGRGASPNMPVPMFNSMGSGGRGMPHDKPPAGWVPPRSSGPAGKAPSRGEQNDYSQNFVDTGMRPQNFIRELELTSTVEDYPKLRELIQKKDEIVAKAASPPMYFKCDLKEHLLSPDFFGTKFDVVLVDPPWEEYVHRAPGVADHMEYWSFEEILNLKIEAIADTPSFIFLWVGDGVGLEQGRQCLKKWGFRRCEDICWVKTNKTIATPSLRHDSHTLFQRSKEHCLMGIKGTVRRSTDGHIIHANIDTDVIIAEEPPYGSTTKPEDIYRIIEHFSLGRRRLELFGEDHNIRSGWLTVGKGLSSSNFNPEAFCNNFADKEGKVWQGGGGRNPPPDAPHLVLTTPDIESLRPKSPPQKNQQQQSSSLSTTTNSSKRPAVNSPQNLATGPMIGINQELPASNPPTQAPWSSSPAGIYKGPDANNTGPDERFF